MAWFFYIDSQLFVSSFCQAYWTTRKYLICLLLLGNLRGLQNYHISLHLLDTQLPVPDGKSQHSSLQLAWCLLVSFSVPATFVEVLMLMHCDCRKIPDLHTTMSETLSYCSWDREYTCNVIVLTISSLSYAAGRALVSALKSLNLSSKLAL